MCGNANNNDSKNNDFLAFNMKILITTFLGWFLGACNFNGGPAVIRKAVVGVLVGSMLLLIVKTL